MSWKRDIQNITLFSEKKDLILLRDLPVALSAGYVTASLQLKQFAPILDVGDLYSESVSWANRCRPGYYSSLSLRPLGFLHRAAALAAARLGKLTP